MSSADEVCWKLLRRDGGAFTVVRCRDADCTYVRSRKMDEGISVLGGSLSGYWTGTSAGMCAAELIRRGGV